MNPIAGRDLPSGNIYYFLADRLGTVRLENQPIRTHSSMDLPLRKNDAVQDVPVL